MKKEKEKAKKKKMKMMSRFIDNEVEEKDDDHYDSGDGNEKDQYYNPDDLARRNDGLNINDMERKYKLKEVRREQRK